MLYDSFAHSWAADAILNPNLDGFIKMHIHASRGLIYFPNVQWQAGFFAWFFCVSMSQMQILTTPSQKNVAALGMQNWSN
jgi:hypothetical protein